MNVALDEAKDRMSQLQAAKAAAEALAKEAHTRPQGADSHLLELITMPTVHALDCSLK
jgi:hypothetical protein